jgi:hypothetical protein
MEYGVELHGAFSVIIGPDLSSLCEMVVEFKHGILAVCMGWAGLDCSYSSNRRALPLYVFRPLCSYLGVSSMAAVITAKFLKYV